MSRPVRFAALLLLGTSPALAANGYFATGAGPASEGQGGVSIAVPLDSLALAANPAGAFDLGTRVDGGFEVITLDRGASISNNLFGANQSFSGNGNGATVNPLLGGTYRWSDQFALGVAAYGNGGLSSLYQSNPYARFGGTGSAGVTLDQYFVSPTIAWQFAPGQTLGAAANFGYQKFQAQGVGFLAALSDNPAAVSNNGWQSSIGEGAKIGYLGHITPQLAVGAYWQSRTYFGKFNGYSGLFGDHGAFDVPQTYGAGISFKATPNLTFSGDLTRIDFGEVSSLSNPLAPLLEGVKLGAVGGPGFGWRDVTVIKLGVNYAINPNWQVRAGYAYNTQPIPSSQTFFNMLAPATVQNNFTAGATYSAPSGLQITGYALYAPENTIDGTSSIPPGLPPGFGGGEANIHLSEFSVGMSVGWKFSE